MAKAISYWRKLTNRCENYLQDERRSLSRLSSCEQITIEANTQREVVSPSQRMFGLFYNLTAAPITGILLAIVFSCSAFVPSKSYGSSDGKVKAVILPVGKKGYEERESRIEIRDAQGGLHRWKSFASADGEHGFGVAKAQWTPNSQFCVFSLQNSGGHQPWHQPIYFYSRTENRFYCLDDYVGPITSAFTLTKSNGISTTRLVFPIQHQQGIDEKIVVRLEKIMKRAKKGRKYN